MKTETVKKKAETEKKATQEQTIEVTKEVVSEWKKAFGSVYKVAVGGEDYYFRKLRRREYATAMAVGEDESTDVSMRVYLRQESIAKSATIFPENMDELIEENAGLATILSDEIIIRSGFDASEVEEL